MSTDSSHLSNGAGPFTEVISFEDLTPQRILVKHQGKGYILTEASEGAAVRYRGFQMQGAKLIEGKLHADMDRVLEGQSLLLSFCLYAAGEDPDPSKADSDERFVLRLTKAGMPDPQFRVSQTTIQTSWDSRVVKRLFERCKQISQLDERDTIESLERRIAADTEKLAELRQQRAAEQHAAAREGADGDEEGNAARRAASTAQS